MPYLIESAGAVTGRLFGASTRFVDGGCGARALSSKTHIYLFCCLPLKSCSDIKL